MPLDLQDYFLPAPYPNVQPWQLGSAIRQGLPPTPSAVLVFYSDQSQNGPEIFTKTREALYRLSGSDWQYPLVDPGNLIQGRSREESVVIVTEVLQGLVSMGHLPVLLSTGIEGLAAQVNSTEALSGKLAWSHVCSSIPLGEALSEEENTIQSIFSRQNLPLQQFSVLGLQKHLNNPQVLDSMRQADYDVLRLSDLMGDDVHEAEPLFRMSNLISMDCDAVASGTGGFSVRPQINGFSSREVCVLLRDAGLSSTNRSLGIYHFAPTKPQDYQLMAQMLWYYLEGINIYHSHPNDYQTEEYSVLVNQEEYWFQRETFSNRWYFGKPNAPHTRVACSFQDYERAKRGELSPRLQRYI